MKRTLVMAMSTLAALLSAGCAELKVHRLTNSSDPLIGQVPYYLPQTAVTITGVLTLKKCGTVTGTNGLPAFEFEFEKTLVAGTTLEADLAQRYAIDYESTRSWLKELKFSVDTYSNRTLQAYTGELNDQAGAVLIAAASAVINVAGAVGLARAGTIRPQTVEQTDSGPVQYCSDEVLAALAKVAKQEAEAKGAADARELALKDPTPTEAHLNARLASFDQKIASAKANVAKLRAAHPLGRPFSAKWVPLPKEVSPAGVSTFIVDTTQLVEGWLSREGMVWLQTQPTGVQDLKTWQRARSPIVVEVLIDAREVKFLAPSMVTIDKPAGLVIRESLPAILRICDSSCPTFSAALSPLTNEVAARTSIALPQFGQFIVLPQKSALFENSQLTVKMNADGSIATLGYRSASTAASGLSGVSAAAKDQMAGIAAANTAAAAANTAAAAQAQYPNLVNKALLECLDAAAKIRAAGGTPAPCQ